MLAYIIIIENRISLRHLDGTNFKGVITLFDVEYSIKMREASAFLTKPLIINIFFLYYVSLVMFCPSGAVIVLVYLYPPNEVVGGILVSPCPSVCRQILCRTIT